MRRNTLLLPMLGLLLATLAMPASSALAETKLRNICRVKGQEENTLNGLGIVVGLKGTGDGGSSLPTIRSLATTLQLMGNPIGQGGAGELKDAKNVALVMVTATVPATGARQGDHIDCTVSSVGGAKSLAGGRLFLAPLLGPNPQRPQVFALAHGPITLEDPEVPTNGRVYKGCQLEEEFFNPFVKDGKITLVLDQNHASFEMAQEVADAIGKAPLFHTAGMPGSNEPQSRALNPVCVEVKIPPQYLQDPVLFVAQVLDVSLMEMPLGPRVTIHERSGSIVIDGDVEIGPVAITHKNIVIETGTAGAANRFVAMSGQGEENPKLKNLIQALNAVQVPTKDIIDIIKGLQSNGKLNAQVTIE